MKLGEVFRALWAVQAHLQTKLDDQSRQHVRRIGRAAACGEWPSTHEHQALNDG